MEYKDLISDSYYHEKGGMLFKGDCLEWMEKFPDKSVDMILADLPYGTTQNKWDSVIDLKQLWKQYKRIIKYNGAIVLTAQTPFDKVLGVSNLEMLKYEWIWDKKLATGHLNAKKAPMKRHENILIFYKKPPTYNPQFSIGEPYDKGFGVGQSSNYGSQVATSGLNESGKRYPTTILEFSNADRHNRLHPTQKPVALFEYLIKTYTNENEIVLDNTAGVCSTAIACKNTNRKWICIEKEEEYCIKSVERILNHKIT